MANGFDLTRYLPYLVNRAGVRLAAAFTKRIARYGVSLQMWRVLAALHHADGQRVSDIAALTSIDVSTLSRLLGTMQRKGLIGRRRAAGADARVVAIHATPRGRAITAKIVPLARRYETIALAGFSAAESQTFKAMLERVYRNIDGLDAPASEAEAA